MSEKTHYFLAIRLPKEIKEQLLNTKERLAEYFHFHKWVHPEDYHITLAFLGYATQNQLIALEEIIPRYLKGENAFSLAISHLGTFGMKSAPRIFWAGINESDELQELRKKVYLACEEVGFELEKRTFHPHITMARKWNGEDRFNDSLLIEYNKFYNQPLRFQATDVVLYKTNLLQTPKYENLITFSLQL